ncbi:hypothetical protein [Archangium primigenium]|uniref:hypothetical protein n=1 Tax=[Archangium] primigenium TaxID=2792470 RepID=UPI00195B1CFF|nr:hypothetical protein [Archangium primigenium]MBM7112114.1 hypothetical protein [Archangium primigenium]
MEIQHWGFSPASCDQAAGEHAASAGASGYSITYQEYPWEGDPRNYACAYVLHNVPIIETRNDSHCPVRSCREDELVYDTVYKTCRHPSFGEAPEGACGSAAGPFFMPGRSANSIEQDAQTEQAWRTLTGTTLPVEIKSMECLTCDHVSNPFDKFQCLRTEIQKLDSRGMSTTARDTLEQQLVHHLKLLFETRSDALVIEQRNHAISFYESKPQLTSGCGTAWTAPVTPSCTVSAHFKSLLSMCNQLRSEHVPLAVIPSLYYQCLSLNPATYLSASCSSADTNRYREEYLELSTAMMRRIVADPMAPLGNTPAEELVRTDALHGKLKSIQTWYTAVRGAYPDYAADGPLMARVNELFKLFWNVVYIQGETSHIINENTTPEQAEAIRQGILTRGMQAERQVLRATFAGGSSAEPPLTGDLVFYVTGDALQGAYRRLEDLSLLHDLSCRFTSCAQTRTKTRQLWGLLGALHDPSLLSAELNAINQLTSSARLDKPWLDTFAQMHQRHDMISRGGAVVFGQSYMPRDWFSAAPSTLPATASAFSSLLKTARARTVGYDTNTLFVLSAARQLEVGLDAQKQTIINDELVRSTTALDARITKYKDDRKSLIASLLSQLSNQQEMTNGSAQMDIIYDQTLQLSKDLDGLRASQAIDEVRHGEFMKSFELLNAGTAASGRAVLKSERNFSVSAVQATYTGQGGVTDLVGVAVHDSTNSVFKLNASEGDIVNIQVTGQWSPTCALSQTVGFDGTKVKPVNPDQTVAMAGPEGFSVTTSAGNYYSNGDQTVTSGGRYENWTASVKACAGMGLPKPVSMVSVQACAGFDAGKTWSQTKSQTDGSGSESSSTLTLSRGLRASRTPFPDQPAGSLLLVRAAHQPVPNPTSIPASSIQSVQVVRAPNTSIVMDSTSDLYFVVNDLSDATNCGPVNNSTLGVTVSHLQPAAAVSRNIFRAMASAEKKVRTDAQAYVAQGRLLPSQAALLRGSAYNRVYAQCQEDCPTGQTCACGNLSSVTDESLRNLFETWLAQDLVGIEREVELVNIERQMRALSLQIEALSKNYTVAGERSRLLALEPMWSMQSLDGAELRSSLGQVNNVLTRWVEPVVRLRHRNFETTLLPDDVAKIKTFTTIDPLNSNLITLAGNAVEVATLINNKLSAARSDPALVFANVIISIPRVDKGVQSDYATVDREVAAGIWRQILAGKDPIITLNPEHLYQPDGGSFVLACTQSAPIINSMAFFVVHNVYTHYTPRSLRTDIAPSMSFPTTTQKYEYTFANNAYLAPTVQMMLGLPEEVESSLASYWTTPGTPVAAGLSPFSSFNPRLGSFRTDSRYPNNPDGSLGPTNPLVYADELLIAFRLEPRAEGTGVLPGVPICH